MTFQSQLLGLHPSFIGNRVVINLTLEHAGIGHFRVIARQPLVGLGRDDRRIAILIFHHQTGNESQLITKIVPIAARIGHSTSPPAFCQVDFYLVLGLQHRRDIILLIVMRFVVL